MCGLQASVPHDVYTAFLGLLYMVRKSIMDLDEVCNKVRWGALGAIRVTLVS